MFLFVTAVAFAETPNAGPNPDASLWEAPRTFHRPFDKAYAERFIIEPIKESKASDDAVALDNAVMSPNGAYWVAREIRKDTPDGVNERFVVATDKAGLRLTIANRCNNYETQVSWINEKLLFVRVWWGRILGTDYIVDAESGKIISREMIEDGTGFFQQVREAKNKRA